MNRPEEKKPVPTILVFPETDEAENLPAGELWGFWPGFFIGLTLGIGTLAFVLLKGF